MKKTPKELPPEALAVQKIAKLVEAMDERGRESFCAYGEGMVAMKRLFDSQKEAGK